MAKRVQVGKIDLDTVGAAFLLGVTREDEVEVLRSGKATDEDLANPEILCVEVGGSGRVDEGNFDHHGPMAEIGLSSASAQAWMSVQLNAVDWRLPRWTRTKTQAAKLVYYYIDPLDRKGPQALGGRQEGMFPTLSDVFAGMLLATREPVEQLHRGVEILREAVLKGIDPLGQMPVAEIPEWAVYANAKLENNRAVARAVENAQWLTTSSGLKMAHLETDFFGAPGALYGVGAQVVVVFSPHYGPAKVPKFTVAGNGVRVDAVLAELNAREPGWGGPPNGTIIGSPRDGSSLTLNEVAEIVRKGL